MISIITCSNDEAKYQSLIANFRHLLPGGTETFRIGNTRSLADGYNRGFEASKGDILIFCHDDIEFIEPDFASKLDRAFETADLIGVAGTTRLCDGLWTRAGYPFIHGQVAHKTNAPDAPPYVLDVYDTRTRQFPHIQAVDGLFIAVKRNVVQSLKFDSATFDGFHLYDVDFSFRAHLANVRVAVRCDLGIVHASTGNYDQNWASYNERFRRKFAGQISNYLPQWCQWSAVAARDRGELRALMNPPHWQPND